MWTHRAQELNGNKNEEQKVTLRFPKPFKHLNSFDECRILSDSPRDRGDSIMLWVGWDVGRSPSQQDPRKPRVTMPYGKVLVQQTPAWHQPPQKRWGCGNCRANVELGWENAEFLSKYCLALLNTVFWMTSSYAGPYDNLITSFNFFAHQLSCSHIISIRQRRMVGNLISKQFHTADTRWNILKPIKRAL